MDLLPTGDLSGWESNMGLLLLFIGLILVTLFGRNIVRLIYPDAARVESLALGYLIGLGLFTLALFLTNLAGLKYAALESNSLLVVLFIISAYLARNTRPTPLVKRSGKITTIITILFGIFFLVPVLLYGLYWPAKDWDSLALYDYRAISFINTGFMDEGFRTGYDFSYPLFTSLSNTWVYSMSFYSPTIIYSLIYISLLTIFYSLIARKTSPSYALFWTVCLGFVTAIYEQAHMTYSNLPYATFLALGYIYLAEGINGKRGRLYLGMLLIALSTWIRIEPFWLAVIPAMLLLTKGFRNKGISTLTYLIMVKIVQIPWQRFKSLNNTYATPSSSGIISDLRILVANLEVSQIRVVLEYIWANILRPDAYLYYAIGVTALLFIYNYRSFSTSIKVVMITIVTSLAMFFIGTYIFSIRYETWDQIGNSAQRMAIFIIPLSIYLISQSIFFRWKGQKS